MARDKTKKDILITSYDVIRIKNYLSEKLSDEKIFNKINTCYNLGLNVTSGTQYKKETLMMFFDNFVEGWYSSNEIKEKLDSIEFNTIVVTKPVEEVKIESEPIKLKTKTVTDLKVGDIVYYENLKHPFLVLNIYKSGLFKSVSLSSSPDARQSFSINSRFLDRVNYVRLTVSINEIEEFKSKWIGSVSQAQIKLVKLFLKQNKL